MVGGGRTLVKRGEGEWSIDVACWRQCSLPLQSGSEGSDRGGTKESARCMETRKIGSYR